MKNWLFTRDDEPDLEQMTQSMSPAMSGDHLCDCWRVDNNPLTPVTQGKLSFTAAGWASSPEVWNNIPSHLISFIALIQRWGLVLCHIPRAFEVKQQCHKIILQITETATHGLKLRDVHEGDLNVTLNLKLISMFVSAHLYTCILCMSSSFMPQRLPLCVFIVSKVKSHSSTERETMSF